MKTRNRITLIFSLLTLLLTGMVIAPVKASGVAAQLVDNTNAVSATRLVTKTADTNDGVCDSDCSLREAIAVATAGDTINFDATLSGQTIYLASTLSLSTNVTIDGSALASQINISGDTDNNGTGNVGVFSVSSSATVTLNSLTIKKGRFNTGGGILNNVGSTLTVTNSTISGNEATSGPGGGIRNDGTLIVTNSTFFSNTATASGGGIRNIGALTVTNSTFSDNSAGGSGGGIYNVSGFTSVTITNSTFSGNQAASQGGGIYYSGGTLNYANTIIANSITNFVPGGDCEGSGTIGTNINNLVEDGGCSASLSGDPNLGSLANNGGPTQTLALLTGSSAINAGDNTTCAAAPVGNLDQRGVKRPQGAQCDIGAYEYQSTVTKLADTNDGVCDSDCSLREAIATVSSGDTILFDSSLSGGTIHLASTLTIAQNMTIDGSALASKITVSGDSDNNGTGDVRVFSVGGSLTVTLDSLIITKGAITGDGGGIYNDTGNNPGAALTVTNSAISGNSASGNGGGIYNSNGSTLMVTNSTLSGNTAATNGGGIYSDGNLLAITGSTLSGNSATGGDGGGVRNGNIMTLTNSTFADNSAAGSGGGIFNAGALTMRNSTLSGNSAIVSAGGIYNNNSLNYANTIIANSTSGGDCVGDIGTNINNLVEDNTCFPSLSGDPSLDSLADNGGPTQTFALGLGSSAIDAGDDATCTNSPVNGLDQRGVTRPVGAHCDIGAFEGAEDITAPTVTAFTVPSATTSLNIPITAFTASDNLTVTGYMITGSSIPPSAGAVGWTASAPTTYTVGSEGAYTLYPWAKDAAANVSIVYGSPATVNVDATAPTASGLVAPDVILSGGTTYSFTVTFSDNLAIDITSLDGSDIRVTGPGGFNQLATLVSVTPTGNGTPRTVTYQITPPGGAWDAVDNGTYTIAVEANQVLDTVGNPVGAIDLGDFLVSLNYTLYLPLIRR